MGNKATKTQTPGCLQPDEVNPVKKKKNDRKSIECEVLGFGDEAAESAAAWAECWKNPNHVTFTSAQEFDFSHLPPEYREVTVMDFIKAVSALTVRLRVDLVSRKRPKGFAFAENRGSRVPHVGSGLVQKVSVGDGPCPCRKCSTSPVKEWFEIRVGSACHVIYDTEEAQCTKVDFFYDDKDSKREGKMTSLWGAELCRRDKRSDSCVFTCITHDQEFYKLLGDLLCRLKTTQKSLPVQDSSDGLILVVSHPHGQPKKITVGKLVEYKVNWAEPRANALTWFLFYNADTCAGSSGAPVFDISSPSNNAHSKVYSGGTFHSGFRSKGNHSVTTLTTYEPLDPCLLS